MNKLIGWFIAAGGGIWAVHYAISHTQAATVWLVQKAFIKKPDGSLLYPAISKALLDWRPEIEDFFDAVDKGLHQGLDSQAPDPPSGGSQA